MCWSKKKLSGRNGGNPSLPKPNPIPIICTCPIGPTPQTAYKNEKYYHIKIITSKYLQFSYKLISKTHLLLKLANDRLCLKPLKLQHIIIIIICYVGVRVTENNLRDVYL